MDSSSKEIFAPQSNAWSNPLITIGITCFNAADTIARAVESAIAQDWSEKEILVVDDCSRDQSWAELERLQAQYPVIRIIRHDRNRGYPAALNSILASAKGEFIAIFDDDDESSHGRLTKQWNRLTAYEARHPGSIVLCYSNRKVVKTAGRGVAHVAEAIGRYAPEPHGPTVADYLFGHRYDRSRVWGMFGSCTLMARAASFDAIGPFDESFRRSAEWDVAVRAAFLGAHFISVNEPLVTQYKTAGADKSGNIPLKYALQLRYKYKEYLIGQGAYWAACAIARSRFHGAKGRILQSYLYMALACLSSPIVLAGKISSGFSRICRRVDQAQRELGA